MSAKVLMVLRYGDRGVTGMGAMEIHDKAPAQSSVMSPGVEFEELAAVLTERRGPKSMKKPTESPADDVDEDVSSSDEAVVEEVAHDVLDTAEDMLFDPDAHHVVAGVGGTSSDATHEQVLQEAQDRGITDVDVQVAEPSEETVVTNSEGETEVIELGAGEKSRAVEVGDETVLVLSEDLSTSEARAETTQFVVDQLEEIAAEYGLGPEFDPFFNFVLDRGFPALIPFLGNYGLPKVRAGLVSNLFRSDRVEERTFDRLQERRKD